MDHPDFNGTNNYLELADTLDRLKEYARDVNTEFSNYLGIPCSAAITCIKPSGTVSQLVNSSSGIHPRYSKFYTRTVRGDNKDIVTQFLKDKGFPWEPDASHPDTMSVFSFPMKSPEGAITKTDRTAIEQLELYKVYADNWCEHNASVSIYIKEDEWLEVLAWVHKNWNSCNGLSFFPAEDHIYKQPPYGEITEEQFNEMLHFMPKDVNFADMVEEEDTGTGYHELACKAGICEI
jgi:ribonucleoside-diphosphate reductase alpha chain